MGTYLSFRHDRDSIDSIQGAAYIVVQPVSGSLKDAVEVSHSCGTVEELEHVLKGIERDIAAIRRKAKRSFPLALKRRAQRAARASV